jgi:hypothetical protein
MQKYRKQILLLCLFCQIMCLLCTDTSFIVFIFNVAFCNPSSRMRTILRIGPLDPLLIFIEQPCTNQAAKRII